MILFIRHGESLANLKGVFAGQRDNSPLTQKGRQDASLVADRLQAKSLKIDKIISSPLLRAKETASIIANKIGYDTKKILIDERLQEYDMGKLSGKPKRHIVPLDYVSADEAEEVEKFQERVLSAISEISSIEGTVLIVSHSGVGRIIEATRLNSSVKEFFGIAAYPNAEIVELNLNNLKNY